MGMLAIVNDWEFFKIKKKLNGDNHRPNPRGEHALVCFPPEMNSTFSRTIT
jgi:hypothetical protein